MRLSLSVSLVLFLLAPYLIWSGFVSAWKSVPVGDWLPYLRVSAEQAWWSSIFSMAAGFALFSGLQALPARWRSAGELALLLPNMLPPLFLILSLLSLFTPWTAFPYGVGAVVVAHVLLNCGLVAIALDRLLQSRVAGMAETAWVLGASRRMFWREIGWPYLKGDLACVFLFVFTLCFTSFSIPLVLGGLRQSTLEVAIYNSVRMEGRWDKAVLLAAIQSTGLFILAWLLPRPWWPARATRASLNLLAWPRTGPLVFLPAVILGAGWASGLAEAWRKSSFVDVLWLDALLTTAALGLCVGLLQLVLFLAVAYVSPNRWLERFLNGYLAPSPTITGFALLLVRGEGDLVNFAKLSAALTLISFPLLYRWVVHSAVQALDQQVRVARVMGAGWSLILFTVVWPQAAPAILRAAGLAAFWAAGDFALSGILAGGLHSLPLVMQDLTGAYRIDSAQLLMIPLIATGLALYGMFVGASRYVAR